MYRENVEILLLGIIGVVIALFMCLSGAWLFYMENTGSSHLFGIAGITIKGKMMAAFLSWLGLIGLFYTVKKTVKYLSQK
jgi:hypothetical protein